MPSSSTSSFSTAPSPPPFSAPSKSSSPSSSTSSFPMMSSSLSSSAPPPFSTAASMSRGGLAIGVPAHQHRPSLSQHQPSQPPPPPPPFSSFGPPSFPQQFGGLGRSSINVPESTANQSSAQVRPSLQTIGMMGSLSSSAQMRPTGLPLHHQQRMVQTSIRSQSPSSNQSLATQKFQNHGLLRGPSVTSTSSPSPSASQGLPSSSQPWMSSAPQLRQMPTPSLPSPSSRQPMRPQSLQQRPNHPQQHHHSMQLASHQQLSSAQPQQQQSQAVQSQDLYGQFSQSRMPPSVAHQQVMRAAGPANQKLSIPTSVMTQLSIVPSGGQNSVANVDDEESGNRILTKRSIRELVNQQIGPSEKLDPEVEDFLMLTAEDFVDSITTYACSLAKHRKSTTLEAKDILLHLERNWNMTVPGFGGEEIKSYKKPFTSDIHKERLVAIKKSMQGSDAVSVKSTGGQATGNVKGHSTKVPSLGSP
ncbi:hypothetical protein Sjap_001197 [Stephania japonica]|uniref:Transcription initiation factor TFIID subunit 12 domain-containing protein n=1 Tax=Stephania japonica TaxID=461633 RepID=A0AAP0KJH8_9MAGN